MKHLLLQLLLPAIALSYSTGPPDGRTGAPSEGTCVQCHNQFPLNSGSATLSITGPASWMPGDTYPITVELSDEDPTRLRWGFELTPLGVGQITVTDAARTQLSAVPNQYIKHTSLGTNMGQGGGNSWSFDWTAPLDPGPTEVIFYAAGNAADMSFSNQGDYIYTTQLAISRAETAPEEITDLSIQVTGQQVSLDWSPAAGATNYDVYRSTSPWSGFTILGSTATPGFSFAETDGIAYYSVHATN